MKVSMNPSRRILVLSNNCFSLTNSNGRTLGSLFEGWPKANLAQMCVIASDPNWDLCDNYYCIEDEVMLRSFISLRKAEGRKLVRQPNIKTKEGSANDSKRTSRVGKKTVIKVSLRELVWGAKRWDSRSFRHWVDDFDPEVVVLQFGDSFFMLDIAYHIATTRHIPLVIYNTEGYYFFPRNWHHLSKWDILVFPIYKRIYHKKVERVMRIAKHCVYLNDKLKEDYGKVFGNAATVIYNSSDIVSSGAPLFSGSTPRMCYLGNLGLDRDSGIIEVGEVLHGINSKYRIEVYGKADDAVRKRFLEALGVEYKGLVSYEQVKQVIRESDILFHVETEKGYKERQLQYAFSTKIADSVSSGKCFVVYAPAELACSKYIIDTKAGWYASNKDQLGKVIKMIINDADERAEVLSHAKITAEKNHSVAKNARLFQDIIQNV